MSRKLARELSFKILFAIDAGGNTVEEAFKIAVDKPLNEDAKVFVLNEVNGVLERKEQIDDIIDDYSIDWRVERLNVSDRNILRIAIYEMFFCDDIPLSVSINEAVEIAKKYGDAKSPQFVNGVLGAVARDIERLRPNFSV
ncbi:NusB antitermination factor [Caldanaerovirga acetigignens]|uniref:Transcription antitermination protein NusB n=1 Tax=Caldanaerovirga acetigignens TaxID=447595 RepID=A0A1M7JFZ3_9FIRM|nr:transcription antitermination factor NusB [Caldanaerovirga acetigignens]SHM51447.1 NusB antitermination factor [Caldanaerovirga acetigignens]